LLSAEGGGANFVLANVVVGVPVNGDIICTSSASSSSSSCPDCSSGFSA
jgi:hypothetical protein